MNHKVTKTSFYQNILFGVLCAVIAVVTILFFPQFEMKAEAAEEHNCSNSWTTLSEGSAYEALYEIYSCKVCGKVSKFNYIRPEDFVQERLEKQIKGARKDWVVISELGIYNTVEDKLFQWLSERNDVTLMVTFEYQGVYCQATFPAGTDYTELLQDDEKFYGLLGLNGRCGIVSMAGNKIEGSLADWVKLTGAEEFYWHIKMAPEQATVYASYGDVNAANKALLSALSQRNDVTAVVFYEYKGMNYKTTFPAGIDYSEILKDGSQFYGMLGLNGRCGIITEINYGIMQ